VWKMRGTAHSMKRHLFEVTNRGIVVYPDRVVKIGRSFSVETI